MWNRYGKSGTSSRRLYRIVIDTNVLISAVIAPGGFPDRIIRAWFLRHVSVLMCQELFAELEDVLRRERIARLYRLSPERRDRILHAVQFAAEWVRALDEGSLPLVSRDPKDNKLLACALGGQADFIVSGDADLLVLNGHPALGETGIVSPREFVTLLGEL